MCLKEEIKYILKNEVVPAMGCTEPVAVALACAKAREVLGSTDIDRLQVIVSPNIYKNGLGVGIPNTSEIGLKIAAALGIVAGNSEKSLRVLEGINSHHLALAHELLNNNKVELFIGDTEEKIYIEVKLQSKNHSSRVIIKNKHNCFTLIEKDNLVLLEGISQNEGNDKNIEVIYKSKIRDIIKAVETMDSVDLNFLIAGIDMNESIALEGLDKKLGLGVGYSIKKSMKKGIIADDLTNNCMMMTAAAADARMSGISMNVMSSNGSGNNGLTAILPLAVYRRMFKVEDERIAKALAISHTINCYIKKQIGRLSALCGCGVAAATGASAAIAWLMGASYEQIDGAIKNMIGNLSGMICDGAKGSCALKVSTAASAAVQSAILAINDSIIPSGTGIIAVSAEETIMNLGTLSKEGMNITDKVILDIMKKMA
ncbi:MAG: serine dehydratase subunit alpha family protein [Clostridiales bacterium]|nr:serine dehydratase subunit alpha family protein [Clostridiales bacterium]